jgi:hypothetical protein
MKKLILPFAALLLSFSTASNAVSVTYDFAAEGNIHEAGYDPFDSDNHGNMPGGLSITASNGSGSLNYAKDGSDNDIEGTASNFYEAYMDGNAGQDAGLGVCQTEGSCAGISDDNQEKGEYIHMVFDTVVDILSLDITGNHSAVVADTFFHYSLDNGATWESFSIAGEVIGNPLLIASLDPGKNSWISKTLDYTVSPTGGEMYLSAMTVSPVPVPAAFWLFGTALIGFVGLSRRINLS